MRRYRRSFRIIGAWMVASLVALAPIQATAQVIEAHANHHFGSNWEHICDATILSQCKGWAQALDIGLYSLETTAPHDLDQATRDVINNQLQPTDLLIFYVSSGDDIGVFDGSYGTTGFAAGWTSCASGAAYFGSEANHTRSCKPSDVPFNYSYASRFDTQKESDAIACQELGHSVGLRHWQDILQKPNTCMYDPPVVKTITQHEKDIINANF